MGLKEDVISSIDYLKPGRKYSERAIHEALEDREFAEYIVSTNGPFRGMDLIPADIKENNPNLYVIAMRNNILYAHYVPQDILMEHSDIFLDRLEESTKLKRDGKLLHESEGITETIQRMPEALQSKYIETIAKAIEQEPSAIWALKDKIKEENPEICLKAVEADLHNFDYLPMSIKEKNPELCIKYAKQYYTINGIPGDILIQNPELVIEAAKKDPMMFLYAKSLPKELLGNKAIQQEFRRQQKEFEKNKIIYEQSAEEKDSLTVKTSRFRDIYNSAKGKLKEAFNKFKNAFVNKDRNTKENTHDEKNNNER